MQRRLVWTLVLVFGASPLLSAQLRDFTNDNGSLIQAELVSHRADKVKLRRADGKEFEVNPSIFNDEDEAYIRNWMSKTPASQNYNLKISTTKKKIEGNSQDFGYKRVKNDLWTYLIAVTNRSQDSVSNLTIHYRVFYTNSADGEYATDSVPTKFRMIEGKNRLEAELAFNRTLELTTKPVQIDMVNYEYGNRYKDSLKGCLVRIVDQAGNVVLDWVSPDVAMKGKDWLNTTPSRDEEKNPVIIR